MSAIHAVWLAPNYIMNNYYQLIILSIFFLLHAQLSAQYPDNQWLLGYSSFDSIDNGFGLVQLDFSNNQLKVGEEMEVVTRLGRNISLISTPAGDSILFYFNGLQLNNGAHELAINGDSMYYGELSLGYDLTQGALILPIPEMSTEYALLSTYVIHDAESLEIYGPELNVSTISTASSTEVVIKNETVASGQFSNGQLTATQHANGRDWWIIWHYENSNRYLRFILSPEGLERLDDQVIGEAIHSGVGVARFSPDGRFFAMHNGISGEQGNYFDLFDFDRCSGLLSNQRQYHMDNYGGIGLEISHNSRYLYISAGWYIYQFDLWAADVFASIDTVAVYDGVQDPFSTAFNEAQLARDGKIYLSATSSMKKLHVIDYPNRQGAACNVRQRGVQLPVRMSFGVPNFPFHRLGPLDGSPCDTLGIDNIPLASFRSDQDSSAYRSFFFQDLSTYEPDSWLWSFGDGNMSTDNSPIHTYAQDGSYEVCLTVSNAYGSDTSCDTLHLAMVNNTEKLAPQIKWQLFPNPAQDYFTFNLLDYYPQEAYLILYNSMGQQLETKRVFAGWNTIEIDNLASGIYHYVLRDRGVSLATGKLVVLHN